MIALDFIYNNPTPSIFAWQSGHLPSLIVYREMAVRAKLIESVAHRIKDALKVALPMVDSVWVRITKVNAPMGGQVESVSVEV